MIVSIVGLVKLYWSTNYHDIISLHSVKMKNKCLDDSIAQVCMTFHASTFDIMTANKLYSACSYLYTLWYSLKPNSCTSLSSTCACPWEAAVFPMQMEQHLSPAHWLRGALQHVSLLYTRHSKNLISWVQTTTGASIGPGNCHDLIFFFTYKF